METKASNTEAVDQSDPQGTPQPHVEKPRKFNKFETEADRVKQQIEAAKLLKNNLKIMFKHGELDDETLHDTIEGETDLFEMVEALFDSMLRKQESVDGIKERQDKLSKRRSNLERSIRMDKAILLQAVMTAEQPLRLVEATLSKNAGKARLVVKEESEVAAKYWVDQDPVIDNAALKADLVALHKKYPDGKIPVEEQIQGAVIEYGADSLSIRRA